MIDPISNVSSQTAPTLAVEKSLPSLRNKSLVSFSKSFELSDHVNRSIFEGDGIYSPFCSAIKCWINAKTLGICATKIDSPKALMLSGDPFNENVLIFFKTPLSVSLFKMASLLAFVSEARMY